MANLFKDRYQAGRILAERLADNQEALFGKNGARPGETVVLALPRGGTPIAWEIAQKLSVPMDLLFIKKIGAPGQPEFAIGAIGEDAKVSWQKESIDYLEIPENKLKALAQSKLKDLKAQVKKLRRGRAALDVRGKTVIVADDGLATGATMISALELLRKRNPEKVIVAVPVASEYAGSAIGKHCDHMVILQQPSPFFSVGQWYEDFTQISDEEVRRLLERASLPSPFARGSEAAGVVIAQGKSSEKENHGSVLIPYDDLLFEGALTIPREAKGVIIFAHGSGSTHKSPRNRKVARALNKIGFATLLFDLLTPDEATDRANVFDIGLLVERLRNATGWVMDRPELKNLPIGYFGASTGAASALGAAAGEPAVKSVVSRGGRPDLAGPYLKDVSASVLLIVGGEDHGVIELNERAKAGLFRCQMVIVPGAGHLFEEGNTMDEVIEYACNWFAQTLASEESTTGPKRQVVEDIEKVLKPLTDDGIDALARALAGARVVMLGEATHGSEEFYKFRRLISERLLQDHGFKFIAVEGDWPDCYRLNRYLQTGEGESARAIMSGFERWPTWMWANSQTETLIEWMRGKNRGFYGLDVYSLYDSIDVIKSYAGKLGPDIKQRLLEAYSCFESFDRDEIAYSRSLARFPLGCESQALDALRRILRLRLEETAMNEEELFDARQNAKIVRSAEQYYRSVMHGESQSWNIRDEHMLDTLQALLQRHDDGAKAIVWAHNTHIGDYHATDMREAGYVNLGGLARERFGAENVRLIGFGTYGGQVLAGRAWDAKAEAMKLPPAAPGSYEDYFHRVAMEAQVEDYYLPLTDLPSLAVTKGHRAVGVVYQPIFEQHGKNYVPTELAKRYDAFVFVDKTSALNAFPRAREHGLLPETWPSGV